ncbi:MAG: hypothetical protein LC778_10220 [Acidobacteria bacterium]|nr:hypothetical protein [Acidobacteriota bacterium]
MTAPLVVPVHRYYYRQEVAPERLNELSDLLNYPPYVYVQRSTAFSIPVSTGFTNVPWETQLVDNEESYIGGNGMWVSSNPTAFTLQRSFVGRVFAKVQWPQMAAVGIDLRFVKTPGSIVIGESNDTALNRANGFAHQVFSRPYAFSTGDIIVIQAHHDDTVSRSLSVTLSDGCWASLEYFHSGGLGTT